MIEKFTQEELEIIKKELKIASNYSGKKKDLLSDHYKKVIELFSITDSNKKSYSRMDTWNALLTICDHTLENYQMKEGKKPSRYSSIFRVDEYREMMTELIDVIAEYKYRIVNKKGQQE